jgi:DNA-binding transcriptional MerR regulator
VERVLLIQRALVIGFSLDELRRVLAVRDRGGAPCGAVKNLVSDRLRALDERIGELHRLRDELRALVREGDARLAATPPGGRAHLLESLGSSSTIEATRRRQDGVAKARRWARQPPDLTGLRRSASLTGSLMIRVVHHALHHHHLAQGPGRGSCA